MLFVNVWGYCSLLGVGICGICVVCVGSGHFSTRPEKIKKCPGGVHNAYIPKDRNVCEVL